MNITLSYILTTYNKLPYLKITLPLLIAAKKDDEEIVVVDGGSKDGTGAYLEELYRQKKIDCFLSEKDFGEAHGTNKAMLAARGGLIKVITDDDIYDFRAVAVCREFMLTNKTIDILGADGYAFNMKLKNHFVKSNFIEGFRRWKETKAPFLFCGLGYMIRKSSLPYLGVFNAHYTIVDMEYSMRVSALKTRIAFYTGILFVNIINPDSNSQKFYAIIRRERATLDKLYPGASPNFTIGRLATRIKDFLGDVKKKIPGTPSPEYEFAYEDVVKQALVKLSETEVSADILS